jgi:hypothetical protein
MNYRGLENLLLTILSLMIAECLRVASDIAQLETLSEKSVDISQSRGRFYEKD